MKVYLLDMGSKVFGDCIVATQGNRSILIDGAHPGDWKSTGGTPSIPGQLGEILSGPPFRFDLLVVTHCHSDHIGCLPRLVRDGTVEFKEALVADEKLGFPQSAQDAAVDAETAMLVAALQEEPQPDLRGAALDEFLADAAKLSDNYAEMLETLKRNGTRILRYTGRTTKLTALEQRFSSFKLRVLGPTASHLKKCRDTIGGAARDAFNAIDSLRRIDSTMDAAAMYRAIVAADPAADAVLSDDLRAALDASNASAARNDQSIVLRLGSANQSVLLTGDMQLADAEVSSVDDNMETLLRTIKDAGPYQFVKIPHHASHNAFNEDVLEAVRDAQAFGISTGSNDPKHPERSVLELLKSVQSDYQWARTDKNGRIEISFENGRVTLGKQRGRFNDSSANIGDAPVATAAPALSRASSVGEGHAATVTRRIAAGEVEVVARIPHVATRVTITVDVAPGADDDVAGSQPTERDRRRVPRPAVSAPYALAGGRKLPPLLFVTDKARVAQNIGTSEAEEAFAAIEAAGQTLVDLGRSNGGSAGIQQAARQAGDIEGVVILGGYDVLPAERYDTLPPSVRAHLGDTSDNDPDDFIVWSDQIYGDVDGDGLADIAVSRIPDGRSAPLVRSALCGCSSAARARRFGLRNAARPFADGVYGQLPGTETMLKSRPAQSQAVDPSSVDAPSIYIMLHGSDEDTSRFWGEARGAMLEALRVANIPDPCGGVVLAGCCWGALTVRARASMHREGDSVQPVTPEQSLALSFLRRGARAFVGCTGAHYSPIDGNYQYFGAPMHHSFWQQISAGKAPAQALFAAKVEYIGAMPHGRTTVEEIAIENKILRQFTCLGLGW